MPDGAGVSIDGPIFSAKKFKFYNDEGISMCSTI